jgi:hypothetical protein
VSDRNYGTELHPDGTCDVVPLVEPDIFHDEAEPPRAQGLYAAALRWLSGHDPRSQVEIARELGVTRAAISKRVVEIADRLGIDAGRTKQARENYSAAAYRAWHGKAPDAEAPEAGTRPRQETEAVLVAASQPDRLQRALSPLPSETFAEENNR